MEITPEDKRRIYLIGGIILILFVVGLMLKFWVYTLVALGFFGAGFFYGRSTKNNKEEKKGFF